MQRTVIHTDQAPKAIGPYSQAVAVPAGRMVFLSGQIPLDPATMELVPGDVSAQTTQVMKNLGAARPAQPTAMASISTRAPRGSAATCTVARAGGEPGKALP